MKYLDLGALHEVEAALNFNVDSSCSTVIGGCEAYTVKAAGADKKLYKDMEKKLESDYAALSPFGTLHSAANRKKFIYMVATLNATHTDYDFSAIAKPDDFRRLMQQDMQREVDNALINCRPQYCFSGLPDGAMTPDGTPIWSPKMWRKIDQEMDLVNCEFYAWLPDADAFDSQDSSIWSHHVLMYNKTMRRVCYLYFREVSALGTSPSISTSLAEKAKHGNSFTDSGFWMGDSSSPGELDDLVIDHPGQEVVDAEQVRSFRDREASLDYPLSDEDDDSEVAEYFPSDRHTPVRSLSQNVMERVEL